MLWRNKNAPSVFLSRHTSGTNGPMKRHSIEVIKFPKIGFTRSNDLARTNISKEKLMFFTPQEHSSQNPDQIFVAKEKKRMLGRNKHNRTESQPDLFSQQTKRSSIEQECDIIVYANKEWATTKPNAIRMKNGYTEVKSRGYPCIRRVRGDNYCALRSILFQILTFCDISKTILQLFPSLDKAMERLDEVSREQGECVRNWSFGQNSKLKAGKKTVVTAIRDCIEAFYDISEKLKFKTYEQRRKIVVDLLNEQTAGVFLLDGKLMEFIKFLMFSQAAYLYQKQEKGEDIPNWFLFLTLRDNSGSLEEFFNFHLNRVGDSLGLEQIEMFLLGKALNVRIKVFRLKSIGEEDFETLYPSLDDTSLPLTAVTLPLSAEDDRHYNVVY